MDSNHSLNGILPNQKHRLNNLQEVSYLKLLLSHSHTTNFFQNPTKHLEHDD